MNLLLFSALAVLLGYMSGWVYGWAFPELRTSTATTSVHPATWVAVVAIGLGALALVIGLAWVAHRWPRTAMTWQRSAVLLAVVAVGWAVAALVVPQLLAWLHRSTMSGQAHTVSAASGGVRHYWIPLGGLVGVLGAVGGAAAPVWKKLGTTGAKAGSGGFVAQAAAKLRRPFLNLVAMLSVPALFGGLLVAFMYQGSSQPPLVAGSSGWQWLGPFIPLVVLGLAWFFGDLNSWSLHTIYRTRLADAFNLERVRQEPSPPRPSIHGPVSSTASTSGGDVTVQARRTPLPLSELKLRNFPEVLICATSNISDYGLVPTGTGAAPFLLSAETVGGPIVGDCDTSAYERVGLRHPYNLTVMDAVSISGAAVAPEMGKMTRRPYRFLLALANVRLGVWTPKPSMVSTKLAETNNPDTDVPPEVNLHTFSPPDRPQSPDFGIDDVTAGAKPDAVTVRNTNLKSIPPPGITHLLNEAFLPDARRSSYVYVTDGGHYDNLGLVELLNRRCAWIWCVDASGDKIDTFETLGQALAIAEAEHGIRVDIHPETMAPHKKTPTYVRRPFCWGTISYPDGNPRTGVLVVVKAGVPEDAPWPVVAFHAANPDFPCDATTNQLYNAARFDAYLALGSYAMTQATAALKSAYATFLTTVPPAHVDVRDSLQSAGIPW